MDDVRLNVRIGEERMKKLKIKAVKEGRLLQDIIRELVDGYLKKLENKLG